MYARFAAQIALTLVMAGVAWSPRAATAEPAHAPTFAVSILDNSYRPEPFTVAPGTTVVWTNRGQVAHTVTSDDASAAAFDSNVLQPGKSYTYTFSQAGAFTYHCAFHDNMLGTIVVENPGDSPASPTPVPTHPAISPTATASRKPGVIVISVAPSAAGSVRFTPKALRVATGTIVRWQNTMHAPAAIVSRTRGWTFMRRVPPGAITTYRFHASGSYSYMSVHHHSVMGTIVVQRLQ